MINYLCDLGTAGGGNVDEFLPLRFPGTLGRIFLLFL